MPAGIRDIEFFEGMAEHLHANGFRPERRRHKREDEAHADAAVA